VQAVLPPLLPLPLLLAPRLDGGVLQLRSLWALLKLSLALLKHLRTSRGWDLHLSARCRNRSCLRFRTPYSSAQAGALEHHSHMMIGSLIEARATQILTHHEVLMSGGAHRVVSCRPCSRRPDFSGEAIPTPISGFVLTLRINLRFAERPEKLDSQDIQANARGRHAPAVSRTSHAAVLPLERRGS